MPEFRIIVWERPAPSAPALRRHLYPGPLKSTARVRVLEKGAELGPG